MKYDSATTLARISKTDPCHYGWAKLLRHLGKTKADDDPLALLTVLDSNGLDDALWVLSYAMPEDRLARHFQAWCAEQVLHHFEAERPKDKRVRDQIAMLRDDTASEYERAAAKAAARAAAARTADAKGVATAAARAAAWHTVEAGAWDAAAAVAAASDVAWATTWGVTRDAQEKQLRKMISE